MNQDHRVCHISWTTEREWAFSKICIYEIGQWGKKWASSWHTHSSWTEREKLGSVGIPVWTVLGGVLSGSVLLLGAVHYRSTLGEVVIQVVNYCCPSPVSTPLELQAHPWSLLFHLSGLVSLTQARVWLTTVDNLSCFRGRGRLG